MERKDSRDDMMFRQAFNENREMLERLAYFSVRDKEAARDIVSSTFLKLWETREKIDMDRFLPYIYISVKNACINYRRDSATHRNVYDNIRQREQSAMEFYTKAMESCNPAELYVEDILAICRGRLENYPPSIASYLYQKGSGRPQLQGDSRSPRYFRKESGQQPAVRA